MSRPADLTFATDDLYHYISTLGRWSESDKPALMCATSGTVITYSELGDRILAVGATLRSLPFEKGEVLSIHLHNCIEYILGFLGCAALGGTVTPSNPMYESNDLSHQLVDSKAVISLTSKKYANVLTDASTDGIRSIFFIEDETCFVHVTAVPAGVVPLSVGGERPSPDSLLALPYSSGTTGKAKGVMLNHKSVVCNILQSTEDADIRFEITESDILVTLLPLFHIYGLTVQMLCSLARRATLVVVPRFEPVSFMKAVQLYKVTCACMVPPMLVILDKEPTRGQFDLSSLRSIYCGAAPLDAATQGRIAGSFALQVRQAYGTTETSPIISVASVSVENNMHGSVGRAVPNTEVLFVDDSKALVPSSEGGELCIHGPQVMMGYLNRPDATSEALRPTGEQGLTYYHTGDAAHLDSLGNIFIGDRKKDLIKVMGFQVAPAELEGMLLELDGVRDACVVGVKDEITGEAPVAFVVLAGVSREEKTALKKTLRGIFTKKVASYKTPKDFVVIDKVPKSASGKILRRMLRDNYGSIKAQSEKEEADAEAAAALVKPGHRRLLPGLIRPVDEADKEAEYFKRYRKWSYGLSDWHGLVAKCGAGVSVGYKLKSYAYELLPAVLDTSDPELADRALVQLFRISVATAGTAVVTIPGQAPYVATGGALAAPKVAVLLLGYAGSSLNFLTPVAAVYEKINPHWSVVITTAPGCLRSDPYAQSALKEQLDKVADELKNADKVIVHCMSNNGHAQWACLLHAKKESLENKIAAIIYDCAPDRNLNSTQSSLVPLPESAIANPPSAHSSIVGATFTALLTWDVFSSPYVGAIATMKPDELKQKVAEAATAYLTRNAEAPKEAWWAYHVELDGYNVFDYLAKNEPPHAPALLIAGDSDDVIGAAAVEESKTFLTAVQPGRKVSTTTLKGPHCQLHRTDSKAYADAIGGALKAVTDIWKI